MLLLTLEQKSLHRWRDVHAQVLDTINLNKKTFKSKKAFLTDYFTSETTLFPHVSRLFQFNIGERVRVDAPIEKRRQLGFKFSLNPGT